jgi:hypothetical protein
VEGGLMRKKDERIVWAVEVAIDVFACAAFLMAVIFILVIL